MNTTQNTVAISFELDFERNVGLVDPCELVVFERKRRTSEQAETESSHATFSMHPSTGRVQ